MNNKFEMILDKNEQIKWCNNINSSAYVKRRFFKTLLFGLFPPFAVLMLGIPYSWVLLLLAILKVIPMWIGIAHFSFAIIASLIYINVLSKSANNTFFCITNKRIIKRSGAFNNDFQHYSLKNIGNIEVDGNIFDRKGYNPSASLIITVKDYHANADSTIPFIVESLNNAYEAYTLLTTITEGNNENLRIKLEK